MSHRALGREHASQFLTKQSFVAEFGRALSLTAAKSLIYITKFQVQKGFDRPTRFLKESVGFGCMYDEFSVADVLILLLYKGTDSNKSNLINYQHDRFDKTIPGNFIKTSLLCITFA